MSKEKILITGGLGFIGSNLAKRYADLGAEVTLLSKSKKNIINAKGFEDNVNIAYGDISNIKDVSILICDKTKIFHLAAQTSGITSMENPYIDIRTNLIGTMNVLESCRKHNRNAKLVLTGTVTEAGKVKHLPITGKEKEFPISIYDANKLICEKYARVYQKSYGIKYTCLRFPTLYGERQQLNSPRFGVTNYFIGRVIKKEPIIIYGNGEFIRDYVYIGDITEALLLASEDNPKVNNQVFLLGSNKKTRFIDMAREVIAAVEEIMGLKGKIEFKNFPEEHKKVDVGDSLVDYTNFNEATGWRPKFSFEEGIRRTVSFYKERHKDYLENERL